MEHFESPSSSDRPVLSRFLRGTTLPMGARLGGLARLVEELAAACASISAQVARANVDGGEALEGGTNLSGDAVRRLDRVANDIVLSKVAQSGACAAAVTEEQEEPVVFDEGDSQYLLAVDPLDGSSNIGVGVPLGTIFGIYPNRQRAEVPTPESFLQPGHELLVAGYAMYGTSTELVLAFDEAPHLFVLEPDGRWRLVRSEVRIPTGGTIYSINEGNARGWSPRVRGWCDEMKKHRRSLRYVGSMVADAHRTLLRGGIFVYPADERSPRGKLRLLYEGAPMAKIFEAAGGVATDGSNRLLDRVPANIHDKTPVALGSPINAREFDACMERPPRSVRTGMGQATPRGRAPRQVECAFELEGRRVRGRLRLSKEGGRHEFLSKR